MYNNIMRKWPFMKVSYAPRLAGKGFSFLAIQRAIKGIFIVPYIVILSYDTFFYVTPFPSHNAVSAVGAVSQPAFTVTGIVK